MNAEAASTAGEYPWDKREKSYLFIFFFFLKEQRVQGLIGMKKTGAKQAGETVLAVGVGK